MLAYLKAIIYYTTDMYKLWVIDKLWVYRGSHYKGTNNEAEFELLALEYIG